jgi:hypothetical protein
MMDGDRLRKGRGRVKAGRVEGEWCTEGRGCCQLRDGDGKNIRDIYKAVERKGRKDAG